MPNWPTDIPWEFDSPSYSESEGFPVIQAPVEGPPKSRRRYTAAPRPLQGSLDINKAQRLIFQAWFLSDVRNGALSFTAPRTDDPNATATYRMVGAPQWGHLGGENWRLTLQLIELPA
mgnify:CR=1 FL=1